MSIRTRYDSAQDRMRVILEPKEGDVIALAVTRRLWMAWLSGILSLDRRKLERASPQPAKSTSAAGPRQEPETAELVNAIRIKPVKGGVRVVFATARGNPGFTIGPDRLERFEAMLLQQARKCGWDPDAAMVRFNERRQKTPAPKTVH